MRKARREKGMEASGAGLEAEAIDGPPGEGEGSTAQERASDTTDSWRETHDAGSAAHPAATPPVVPRPRVLVGGIGYRNLRDHSLGIVITERLRVIQWPHDLDVVVEDLSDGPIALVQRLDADPPAHRFTRLVVVSAVARGGARWPGAITCYRWDGVLPPDNEIRRAMTEAVTGTVSLDNTLIVARHFDALPMDVVVVEVEPAVHEFGETLSTPVAVILEELMERIIGVAVDTQSVSRLPRARLGGGVPLRSGGPPFSPS